MHPLRQSSPVLLGCFLTTVQASTVHHLHNPHTLRASGVADLVLLIIFAALAFLQLAFIALPELLKMQNGDSITNGAGSPGSQSMCRYKLTFAILMIFALLSFMASYSLRAASVTGALDSAPANIFTTEIARELTYAALLVLLAACTMASEAWHGLGNTTNTIRKAKVFNFSLVVTILVLMVVLTFVCTLVVAIDKTPKILPLVWFVFHQAHVLLYVILTIYYVVPAVSLWRTRMDPIFDQLDLLDAGGTAFIPVDVSASCDSSSERCIIYKSGSATDREADITFVVRCGGVRAYL